MRDRLARERVAALAGLTAADLIRFILWIGLCSPWDASLLGHAHARDNAPLRTFRRNSGLQDFPTLTASRSAGAAWTSAAL